MSRKPPTPPRGRGALSQPDNRFESQKRESVEEGSAEQSLRTHLLPDAARTILNRNNSPDVGFSLSINPYRGCEHGCVYCFARPTHAYLGLSPGLDFETRIFFKQDAPSLLRAELSKKSYRCEPVALGINTDSYQPVEEKMKITRSILEVLEEFSHPVTIVTKSSLIERDIDLLGKMARKQLANVFLSIPTLNEELSRSLEPRAAAPWRRIEVIRNLTSAGIPTGVLVAPVIPVLTDHEPEKILKEAREAGAISAGYVLLRLPLELRELFGEWLDFHVPLSSLAVLSRMREFHGGKLYDPGFGERMRGSGPLAELLEQRFHVIKRKLGYREMPELETTLFRPPSDLLRNRLFPDFPG
ncbi:MAG: PA0069 family radical SAM protein [Leptospirillum sp.]|jgi:DNA repair photolyase